jgi:hypothetical protein
MGCNVLACLDYLRTPKLRFECFELYMMPEPPAGHSMLFIMIY